MAGKIRTEMVNFSRNNLAADLTLCVCAIWVSKCFLVVKTGTRSRKLPANRPSLFTYLQCHRLLLRVHDCSMFCWTYLLPIGTVNSENDWWSQRPQFVMQLCTFSQGFTRDADRGQAISRSSSASVNEYQLWLGRHRHGLFC